MHSYSAATTRVLQPVQVFFPVAGAYRKNKPSDQDRAYLAFGYRFARESDLEIGYLNQYINGLNDAFTNNHILQLATYLRL